MEIKILTVTIRLLNGKVIGANFPIYHLYPNSQIPVQITFENSSDNPLKILKAFEPTPIFFQFEIVAEDGTIIDVPGGGKIAIDNMEYLTLAPNETYIHKVDISSILDQPLENGKYSVSIEYHNQYGDKDCFTGKVVSNSVHFEVIDKEQYQRIAQ
jgi:hypothetical protein